MVFFNDVSKECFIRKFWKIIVIINLSEKLEKIKMSFI